MEWTSDLPTQDGWYWLRWGGGSICVKVFNGCVIADESSPVNGWRGEWYGPIEPPSLKEVKYDVENINNLNFIQALKLLKLNQTKEISSESSGVIYFKDEKGRINCKISDPRQIHTDFEHFLATDWKMGPSWKPVACYECKENSTLILINGELV